MAQADFTFPSPSVAAPDAAELDAFVRDLVHEVRTPLGQVLGLAELVLRIEHLDQDASLRPLLELQASITRGMIDAVGGLLDLARRGSAADAATRIDLSALCRELATELAVLHDREGRVDVRIQDGMRLVGIRPQIRLLMRNLMSNAMKYAADVRRPAVSVSSHLSGATQVVDVIDNGPGFPAGSEDRLFRPFSRLDPDARIDGLGLGLCLARRIAERHGGSLRIQLDAARAGGRVRLSLPALAE